MTLVAPDPAVLARLLHQTANRLEDEGTKAILRACVYAARGLPAATINIGPRGADNTSSTERAALNPHPFVDIDTRFASQRTALMAGVILLHATLDQIMAHAADNDEIPAGTGPCHVDGCDHLCQPRRNPNDRLKAGFCPKHWTRWVRLGRPDRGEFIRYAETEGVA